MTTDKDETGRGVSGLPLVQRLSAILWPSFLLAGAATGVFFTFFDPVTLLECQGEPPLGRMAAYSLGFFGFWLLCAGTSAATYYFLRPGAEPPHARRRANG